MNYKSPTWLLGGMLALVACSNLPQPTATTTNVSLASTVRGTSSLLLVNGQPLDVSGASVTVDDEQGSSKDVKPGMEISGDGTSDGKGKLKMSKVELRWRMKGTIDAIDTANSTLDVVGLRAKVDNSTLIFKENTDGSETPLTFGDLAQGDYVKLAGLPQSDDSVLATRIEVKTESDTTKTDFRVLARKLDGTAKTFTYGLKTITVDFSQAKLAGTPAEGKPVRVKGVRSGDTITASLVKGSDPQIPGINGNGRLELRGLVSGLDTNAKTFVVRDITINYANAKVEGTLADKVVVEVQAKMTGDKTADALKVEVEGDSEHGKPDGKKGGNPSVPLAKLEGSISSFDGTAKTLKIHDIAVGVINTTKYEVSDAEVSADVFWGTNRDGASAQAIGSVVGGNFVASKIETK